MESMHGTKFKRPDSWNLGFRFELNPSQCYVEFIIIEEIKDLI